MSRNWCFTLNNYSAADEEAVKALECRYVTYGREVGESGTPHLQGFVVFECVKRLTGLRKMLPTAHFEMCKGSPAQNIVYCQKDGDFYENGRKPMSNTEKGDREKKRYKAAFDAAKAGDFESVDADILVRCYRTLKEIRKDYMAKPLDAPGVTGVWFYGDSGAGKSATARLEYPGAYLKMANKWFDGYQGEPFVIIDDLDKHHKVLGHHLKIWMDRYSFLAETKGGAIHIRPERIIVTSQYSIEDIWDDEPETVAAVRRRCDVRHFSGVFNLGLLTERSVVEM